MTKPRPTSQQLFHAPGEAIWSPALIATALGLSASEMAYAFNVSESVMRLHPEDTAIQKKLSSFADVFDRLLDLNPDTAMAVFHTKNTPIRVLGQRTILDLLRDNESEKILRYLQTVSGGQSG
ncbi:hypothetical protein [Lysobacter sp. Root559]|uniref:hypothetical protein n=1 Tax=Lysobacter sp. Root559 TaxID=1736559 RepID=UPI000A47747C|nr:hypothetical protein [Lysobacter sp. Root559]